MNEGEEHCQFVSSRGILKSCDFHPRNPISSIRAFPHADYPTDWFERLQPGNSVYVCTSALPDFVANIFPRLPQSSSPFVLVTGDADELAPTDIFPSPGQATAFLNSPRIMAWYAQNCVGRHPKLMPLPIGLDYHTIAAGAIPWWGPTQTPAQQEAELMKLRHADVGIRPPHRAYANFHFNTHSRFGKDRQAAIAQVPPACVEYGRRETPRLECWQRQRLHHRFVLSPTGNGLDCHRTWEALCLGCIPIVHTSPLDPLWEGLPVWVVNSWSEVTQEAMAKKAAEIDRDEELKNTADRIPAKLLLKFWVDRIRTSGTKR